MPTFDSVNIWGVATVSPTPQIAAAEQVNEYPQVQGVEIVHLGGRGRFTVIEGYLTGGSEAALSAAENVIRLHQEAGTVAPFLDALGAGSTYCKIVGFEPSGPVIAAPGDGILLRRYRAMVRHLV